MAGKEFHFHSDARGRLLEGVRDFAEAIKVTLGPRSKSVLIQQAFGPPLVCDDGVTIAKQAVLKDPVANLGVQMLKQAAEKTADAVGDGTSTSTLLAYALFKEGVRNITAGASAVEIKRGLDLGLERVLQELSHSAIPIHTRREKMQVATISAHGDEAIGGIVAEALEKGGDKGIITVEESKTTDTQLEIVEGMHFERGYLSHYFVTDADKLCATLDNPLILLMDRKISTLNDIVTLLEEIAKSSRTLLIVAEDVQAEALATLVVNQVRGTLHSVAVKAPGYGERRLDILEDIAVLTGAQVISEQKGMRLEDVTLEALGNAETVTVTHNATTIGFDAANNRYMDMIETDIVDPAQVVKVALEHAVSVAGTLLLTEATMTDIPEEPARASRTADLLYE